MHWLNLIRWKNMVILLCMMLIGGWLLHVKLSIGYFLLTLCVLLTAAAGNIWNDLNDQKTDRINKPQRMWIGLFIPKIHAIVVYWILNGLATFFSLVLYFQGIRFVLIVTLIAQCLLFFYSILFKRLAIIGNIVIAILAWLCFILLLLYAAEAEATSKRWAMHLGMLAFLTTWMREAVKDMQDAPGDREAGYHTQAVIWPLSYSRIYFLFLVAAYLSYVGYFISSNSWLTFFPARLVPYLIILLIPIAWITLRLLTAEKPDDFKRAGFMIKIWMVIGILSVLLWKGIVF